MENQQKKPRLGVVLRQNLGQIMSNVVKKVKKQAILLGFFMFYWMGDYILKGVRTKFLPDLGQKWQKN